MLSLPAIMLISAQIKNSLRKHQLCGDKREFRFLFASRSTYNLYLLVRDYKKCFMLPYFTNSQVIVLAQYMSMYMYTYMNFCAQACTEKQSKDICRNLIKYTDLRALTLFFYLCCNIPYNSRLQGILTQPP